MLADFKELLERAIKLDPHFALAHSFLGMYYTIRASLGLETAREMIPPAMAVEREALRVDPFLPEAHALLAVCIGEYEHDWSKAERYWRFAMNREPVSRDVVFIDKEFPPALGTLGSLCAQQGRYEEALVLTERARNLLPWCISPADILAAEAHKTDECSRLSPAAEWVSEP